MKIRYLYRGLACALALPLAVAAQAGAGQQRPDPQALMSAQKAAMSPLSFMDGTWRGTAWTALADGKRHTLTQTERVGSLLGGTVKLVEGRGYEADGRTSFNALGIISYNPATKAYSIKSYAMGFAGEFPLQPTATGFVWQTPAGPGAIIRYTANFERGTWHEIGERVAQGTPPVKIFEMRLTRIGDTAWPGIDPVPPRPAKPR